jgi:hypothetical protein
MVPMRAGKIVEVFHAHPEGRLRNPDPPPWQKAEQGIEARPLTLSLSPSEGA